VPRNKHKAKKSGHPISVEQPVSDVFAEAPAWKSVGKGWRPLFGSYRNLGFSFEWHEFTTVGEFDWGRSFHPGSVELCLNLEGVGTITDGQNTVKLQAQMFTFYYQGTPPLKASRQSGTTHRFITIEFSPGFLGESFRSQTESIHPLVRSVISGEAKESAIAPPDRMITTLQQLMESLRHCPVFAPAQEMWFRSKALEIAAHLFFQPTGEELFCSRTRRLARERVGRAQQILREKLQNPPALEELAHMVNCSSFYLSRLFSQEAGMTMQQYLRRIRMDRAAELLRSGKCNVTEAAMEVGYNSLSHFSSTFHETFGCCPGLYPLKVPGLLPMRKPDLTSPE
jgi:AraC family transcriptional regulator